MDTHSINPAIFLIITIISFIQFFFILRFLCEIMRVSYNNQITQLIVKFTDPILVPLRIIPLYFGRVDLIIIIVIVLITALKIYLNPNFSSFEYSINALFIAAVAFAIKEVTDIIFYAVIIGAIGTWFMAYNSHPIFILIDEICEPLYRPIRKIIPSTSGIDFSPIILLVALNLLQMIILPPIFNLTRYF